MMKTFSLIQQFIFVTAFLFFLPLTINAQTLIDFDDDDKWIRGSSTITGYCTDHEYVDGVFLATGGDASRITNSDKDGVAGALGTYAWKLKDRTDVEWIITIASGGVQSFSVDIRRWDNDPGPNYQLEYSTDGGSAWEEVAQITNESLDNLSEWKTFSGTINSSEDNILIRLIPTQGTERIMVDNFEWYSYTASEISTPDQNQIEIWPNPATRLINGKFDVPLSRVEVFSLAGRIVKEQNVFGKSGFSVPVNDLKNGIYIVRVTDDSQKEYFSRFVIAR